MFFVFFKQKTAYEMRISDWSSDVCSSDLALAPQQEEDRDAGHRVRDEQGQVDERREDRAAAEVAPGEQERERGAPQCAEQRGGGGGGRSEERRVGQEGVSTCSSRWSPLH